MKHHGDNNKYCEFHGDKHHTNDCYQLRKQIKDALQSGELAHPVKRIKEKWLQNGGKDIKEERVYMVHKEGMKQEARARSSPQREALTSLLSYEDNSLLPW
jgi:hypothetical protein